MVAKRCIYNKHFMVTADDKVPCKYYFNNLTILLFYFCARAEAVRRQ